MNKAELIDAVAKSAKITKVAAGEAIDSIFAAISKELKKGGEVRLVGFGTFAVSHRKASEGRNPRTGAKLRIPAYKLPKFRAGKALKAVVNKK